MLAFGYHKALKGEYALMRAYREGRCGEKEARASGIIQLIFGSLNIVFSVLLFVFENKIILYMCALVLCLSALALAIVYMKNRK